MTMRLPRLMLIVGTLTLPGLAQIVLPNGFTSTVGPSSNTFPWSTTSNAHIQWIYDSTNFTLQGVNYPILISSMRFRADDGATTVSWTGGTYPNVVIDVGPAAVDYLAMTNTYASNRGAMTNVLTGAATVTPGTCNGAGIPAPWYINIPFATPVLYDPTSGVDLLVDVLKDQTGWSGGSRATEHAAVLVKRCYVTGTTALTSPTGTVDTTGPVIEFSYTPAAGLYPAFTASVTSGSSPLAVNFTDQTFTSAPGGVTSWAWDLDGDSVIDSNLQNPSFNYGCGTYTVSLTVTDGQFPAATLTKTGYIVVDTIAANFTAAPTGGFAPLNVQFTDTSTGPVTGWSWDLDGDTIPDSNLQSPNWNYAVPGNYTVSLTVTNSCRTNTRTRTNLITVLAPGAVPAPAEILQYQFNEVRGQDVANTASTNVMASHGTVTGANWQADPGRPGFRGNEAGFGCLGDNGNLANLNNTVNTNSPLNQSGDLSFSWWQRMVAVPGTTIGYTFGGTGSTARCFTGGVAGTSLWYRSTSVGDINATYNVQANPGVWEHVCLVINNAAGTGTWYFNGTQNTVTNFTPNAHTIALTEFHWAYQTSTGTYSRYYDTDDVRIFSRALAPVEVQLLAVLPEAATAGTSGSFCNGPGGTPVIGTSGGNPTIGNASFAVNLSNAEDSCLAAIAFGFGPVGFGTFDLSPWLGAGCFLQTDAVGLTFHVTAGNAASQNFSIPGSTTFAGLHVYGQWLVLGTVGAATRLLDINIQ